MKKSFTFWDILPVLLIISGVLLLIFQGIARRKRKERERPPAETPDSTEPDEPDEPEPNREQRIINHYSVIRQNIPVSVPDDVVKMITAQAMHETGIFTSRLYREQNNLFGMRQPTIRETLSTEGRNGWATFASLDDSVKDLLLYYREFKLKPEKWTEVHTFIKDIKNAGYFEEQFLPYFNAVRTHYNTVKTLIQ